MSTSNIGIAQQVKKFCTQVGADPLLVQGAGGNVSWKDGELLWVKASGTWLAEAETKEIFVSVNLTHLLHAVEIQDFSVKPEVNDVSGMRPSIETLLHALMPHKVVVHLHPVEILTHMIKVNAAKIIKTCMDDSLQWIYVDYFKPGEDLARAVFDELTKTPQADVVFMANHGVVVGGETVNEVLLILETLICKFKVQSNLSEYAITQSTRHSEFVTRAYVPCPDKEVRLLALNDELINMVRNHWALYPDHVVFLGAEAVILEKDFNTGELDNCTLSKPPYIIAIGDGVYESLAASPAQKCQLRCYFDVVSRLDSKDVISALSRLQVSDLLDWDAEKYRINYSNS